MSIKNALILSTLAGMSTMLGGIIIFLKIKEENINKFITYALSFSISIMIGISLFDLIPSSVFSILYSYELLTSLIIIFLSFGLGIILIFLINRWMQKDDTSLYHLGILSMLALIIHNFPEGIATFIGSITSARLGIKLTLAIALHNIPEGIAIAVPLYYSTKKKSKALFNTFLSGMAEPLGALLAYLFLSKYITNTMISITLLFVAGIMITLSIEEMLPKAKSYHNNKFIYLGLFSGLIILIINFLLN